MPSGEILMVVFEHVTKYITHHTQSLNRFQEFIILLIKLSDWWQKNKFSATNQKPERWQPSGTGLVRHCPQGLFSPFFTFLRAIFFRPFRLSLAPTICP